jgi:hypothetical protein
VEFDPATDDQVLILKHAIGPSGKLRATSLRRGDTWLIGHNEEACLNLIA